MIIVGLGNPGKEYASTRHNIGFMFVDRVADYFKCTFRLEKKHQVMKAECVYLGEKIQLIKPITYMNNSGMAVRSVMDYIKATTSNVLVVYDDLDLPTGLVRIRKDGSSGGHKGMKSIIDHLGTNLITRIRIGIGPSSADVIDFVLQPFSKKEMSILEPVLNKAPQIIEDYITKGMDFVMNQYNG